MLGSATLYFNLLNDISHEVGDIAKILRSGSLVAIPTETVYGLAARYDDEKAIQEIYRVKGRPSDNPLIVHVSNLSQVASVVEVIPDMAKKLIDAFWPGPLTLVMKKSSSVLPIVTGGLDSVAVRMPAHKFARDIIDQVALPLVAPSANLSGKPSPTCASDVLEDLGGAISAVADGGACDVGIESTVVDVRGEFPIILRPGGVTAQEIESLLGVKILRAKATSRPASPGMKYRHYAPNAKVTLFSDVNLLQDHFNTLDSARTWTLSNRSLGLKEIPLLAKTYYQNLRSADRNNISEILIYCDKETLQNMALMNRLSRSADSENNSDVIYTN